LPSAAQAEEEGFVCTSVAHSGGSDVEEQTLEVVQLRRFTSPARHPPLAAPGFSPGSPPAMQLLPQVNLREKILSSYM